VSTFSLPGAQIPDEPEIFNLQSKGTTSLRLEEREPVFSAFHCQSWEEDACSGTSLF